MDFSFQGVKDETKYRLSLLSSWSTTLYFGVYERLVDVLAYITSKMIYVAEYFYREACLKTAQKLKSVIQLIWSLSYRAYRKVGATGILVTSADPSFSEFYVYSGNSITIPRWTKFTDSSKTINIYSTELKTYSTGTSGVLNIPVKEGVPKEYLYVANGVVSEVVTIFSGNIDDAELEVLKVDEDNNTLETVTVLTPPSQDGIYFINDLINLYCEAKSADDFQSVTFTFGDGISSRQLLPNDRILFKYAETLGDVGNVQAINKITVVKDTLYDSATNVATLYVKNTDAITGGSSYEDIESIRENSRRLFYAGYRCGTKNDWKYIIESFSFIYKAYVWTINDVGGSTLLSDQNKIFICALNNTGNSISETEKTIVSTTLEENYSSPSEVITFENPLKVYFVVNSNITISNGIASNIIDDATTLLYNTYSTLNVEFQTNIYYTGTIGLINSVTGVKYHETSIQLMDGYLSASKPSYTLLAFYDNITVPLKDKVLITSDSLELWLRRYTGGAWLDPIKVGHSVGTSFIGDNGYTIDTSSINYTTGTISYNFPEITSNPSYYGSGIISPQTLYDPGYSIFVKYTTEDGLGKRTQDVRLSKPQLITDVDTSFFNITAST